MATSKIDIWNMALDRIGQSESIEAEDEDTPAAGVCARHWPRIVREALEAHPWHWATRQRVLVSIDTQVVEYSGNDVQDSFPAPVVFLDVSQVSVELTASGVVSVLAQGTDYTVVAPHDNMPGSVTLVVPPAFGESLAVIVSLSREGWEHVYGLPADFVAPVGFIAGGLRYDAISATLRAPFELVPTDAGDGLALATDLGPDDFDAFEYVAALESPTLMPARFSDALAWALAAELADALRKDAGVSERCRARYAAALGAAAAADQNARHDTEPVTPTLAARG